MLESSGNMACPAVVRVLRSAAVGACCGDSRAERVCCDKFVAVLDGGMLVGNPISNSGLFEISLPAERYADITVCRHQCFELFRMPAESVRIFSIVAFEFKRARQGTRE